MHRTLLVSILVSTTTIATADTPDRPATSDGDSLAEVKFKRGSKRLQADARDDVEQIAAWHADHPGSILILEGHTSREGSWNRNLRFSQDRTDVVRDALVLAGADPSRIVLVARGDNRGASSRRAPGRVVIRATGDFPELAGMQRERTGGDDTRAARRPVDQRRTGSDTVRGREVVGGNTIVIVPGGGAAGSAPTTIVQGGALLDDAGGAGRTSGGTGASAQTGLGIDPTDGEDRVMTTPGGQANVIAGPQDEEATRARGAGTANRGTAAGAAGGATGGTATGAPVGAGVTGTGPGAATAPTTGGATGAGTATGAGASGAGTAGSTTRPGTAGGGTAGGGTAPTGGTGGGGR